MPCACPAGATASSPGSPAAGPTGGVSSRPSCAPPSACSRSSAGSASRCTPAPRCCPPSRWPSRPRASPGPTAGGLGAVGASASAIAVVVGGLAIFVAPALGRLLRRLDDERAARIREDERATVAAHLHDSVLQSLVLLQRTDDPRRMSMIARRQERELRAWLYG